MQVGEKREEDNFLRRKEGGGEKKNDARKKNPLVYAHVLRASKTEGTCSV